MLSVQNTRICSKCPNTITPNFYYRDTIGWSCKSCAPEMIPCKASPLGCTYMDFPSKTLKHDYFFCARSPKCGVCMQRIFCSLLEHYGNVHDNTTHRAGERFRAYEYKYHHTQAQLVLTDCGPIVVDYALTNDLLSVDIMAPVPSNYLHQFTCTVHTFDPIKGTEYVNLVKENYSDIRDWYFTISPRAFPDWSGFIEVSVDVVANKSEFSE